MSIRRWQQVEQEATGVEIASEKWQGVPPHQLHQTDVEVARMVTRIVVSVQQFTSFRNFAWCPLGSLHRRLRDFDSGLVFQQAVEYLLVNGMVEVNEYANPRSDFNTKGIELDESSPYVAALLAERDEFIRVLLLMYRSNMSISPATVEGRPRRQMGCFALDVDYEDRKCAKSAAGQSRPVQLVPDASHRETGRQ